MSVIGVICTGGVGAAGVAAGLPGVVVQAIAAARVRTISAAASVVLRSGKRYFST
jgi:hypothetical protein